MLCQIYEHGRGLAFHFDKDEHLLKEEGTMMHPIVNSIIYLTGDSAKSRQGTHRSLEIREFVIALSYALFIARRTCDTFVKRISSCKPISVAIGRCWGTQESLKRAWRCVQ